MSQLVSSTVLSAVGLACKAFLNSGLCSITVSNLPALLDALSSERKHGGQGLITVSNHLSTSVLAHFGRRSAPYLESSLDDPVIWGILPFECFTNTRTIRWVLGASDIAFTNPLFSAFFRSGQVIETFRGNGIWQPALDEAIEKLNQGHWLHMFSEGKVQQPPAYPQIDGIAHLSRFKWGLGRIIMECNVPPLIIPMWLTGFDKLMPEHRPVPYKFLPRMGVRLGVAFGDPIPPDKIMDALKVLHRQGGSSLLPTVAEYPTARPPSGPGLSSTVQIGGWMENAIIQAGGGAMLELEDTEKRAQMDKVRSEVTAIIQRAVEGLGRKVSGDRLDLPLSRQSLP